LLIQSTLSIIEETKIQEEEKLPQPLNVNQQVQNVIHQSSPIKLTIEEEEALIFLLELMV
jgi:hypothetical protein